MIQWCDTLPEYRDGRYQFLIDRTGPQSVTMRLTGFKSSIKHPRNIGEYVLEILCTESGEIFEVVNGHTVSNGRFEQYLQSGNSTMSSNIGTTSDESTMFYNAIEQNPSSTTDDPSEDPPPDRVYACLAVFHKEEKVPNKSTADNKKSVDETKVADKQDKLTCSNQSPTTPEDTPIFIDTEGTYNPKFAEALRVSYPMPRRVDYIPPQEIPTNGLLAA